MRSILSILALLLAFQIGVYAQSSCSCGLGNGGCSASQSCPSGYVAFCTCSASGCSSQCNKQDGDPPEGGGEGRPIGIAIDVLRNIVRSSPAPTLGRALSRAFDKKITFSPTSAKFSVDAKILDSFTSHWELLSYLSTNGKLTINGRNLEFWEGLKNTLLNGGAFKICTGNASAQMILNEINFLSGRHYKIVGGNVGSRMSGTVEGNSLNDLIANLSSTRAVMISEN
ncbi:MAG: hypothetical protein KF736_13450 [Acidobacteria bacterium]|nr:hypothetical protein [Acidobacteriota bacterium]MCW5949720.1 hypothetical protein [Pyrinomonadaceae bacterium]